VRGLKKYQELGLLSSVLIMILPPHAHAQNIATYEITDTSLASPEGVGGEETVITWQDIDTYQENFLTKALPYVPSVNLTTGGPPGRLGDFTIRGARSSQNLVLVDGIYANDPASGGGVDLSNFLNADLEKIEILPGPQTLIYGPGALGGVIQLMPQKGRGKPSLKGHAEGGSFRTAYGFLTGQGEEGPLQFSATIAGFNRGPGSFVNPLHGNLQSDRYKNGTLSSRIGYALTDNWEVEGLIRYFEGRVQFDDTQFFPKENAFLPVRARNFTDAKTLLASLNNQWGDETWEHSLKATYSRTQRHNTTPTFHNTTLGEHPALFYRSDIALNDQNTLIAGLEGGQERATEQGLHKRNHGGLYVIHLFKPFPTTDLKGGIRFDKYQSLESRWTFNVGADQKMGDATVFRTSIGNNFKPPILSDLFQKTPFQVPNPHLKPEKSLSFEAGIDHVFAALHVKASLTGFVNKIDHITLSRRLQSGKFQRFNGAKRIAKGAELALGFHPIASLEGKIALTYTQARDYPHKRKSPLIPTFKGAGGLQWQALPDLSFFVQGYGVTSRKDSVTKHRLSPYGVLHVGGGYDVTPQASFFWRIENLTNKHYEDVFGHGNRGRGFFIGLEAKT
jgi:vitamin B12 transporter